MRKTGLTAVLCCQLPQEEAELTEEPPRMTQNKPVTEITTKVPIQPRAFANYNIMKE